MSEKEARWLKLADKVEELAYQVVFGDKELRAISPTERYLIYVPLMSCGGTLEAFGLNRNCDEYERAFDSSARSLLDGHSKGLGELLEPFNLAYTVVNYWSPFDNRRHSVVHRRRKEDDSVVSEFGGLPVSGLQRCKAYAIVFYLLTHKGCDEKLKLLQLIQHLALAADRKCSLAICYEPKRYYSDWPEASPAQEAAFMKRHDLLCIPPSVQKDLLVSFGMTEIVDTLTSCKGCQGDAVDKALRLVLANDPTAPWTRAETDIWCVWNPVVSALKEFRARAGDLEKPKGGYLRGFVSVAQEYLANALGVEVGEDDKQLGFAATCFMLATQALWRHACPADFTYAFPTRVEHTCCVLTAGKSGAPLTAWEQFTISRVARSLFTHALLADMREITESGPIWSLGHAIGAPLSAVADSIWKAQSALSQVPPNTEMAQQYLNCAEYARKAAYGIGFMANFMAENKKNPGTRYFWAERRAEAGEGVLLLSKEKLAWHLREALQYGALSGSVEAEAGAGDRGNAEDPLSIYWLAERTDFQLFSEVRGSPSLVPLKSPSGGACFAVLSEPIVNAVRHNDPNDFSLAVILASSGDSTNSKRLQFVVVNRRYKSSQPVTEDGLRSLSEDTVRQNLGLGLWFRLLRALEWEVIIESEQPTAGRTSAKLMPVLKEIAFDLTKPWQAMGWEAPCG